MLGCSQRLCSDSIEWGVQTLGGFLSVLLSRMTARARRGCGEVGLWGPTKSSQSLDVRNGLSVVSIPWAQGSVWLEKSLHGTHMSRTPLFCVLAQ